MENNKSTGIVYQRLNKLNSRCAPKQIIEIRKSYFYEDQRQDQGYE